MTFCCLTPGFVVRFVAAAGRGGSGGLLRRLLRNPTGALTTLAHHLGHAVATVAPRLAPCVVAAAALAVLAHTLLRRRRQRRMNEGARLVAVLPPPQVDPAGAPAFWANLVALLRPAWRRLLDGQPHLVFEYRWDAVGLQIRIWVPGVVPPGLVERAVQAAWPGARTSTAEATAALPSDDAAATAGELRLAAPDWFPIRHEHEADPLRALLGAATGLTDGETVCVQVLARPVTGRRLTRAHTAIVALRTGRPATRLARLLDLLTPGPAPTSRQPTTGDPETSADVRAILAKAAHPQWETVVRYAVTTTSVGVGRRRRPRVAALQGRAHAVASAFALYTGRNRLARHRLHHPRQKLNGRRLARGDLLSVPELAALAHLPLDAAVPGLARAGATTVGPPPAVPAVGKPLGHAETGARRPVALAVTDARHHLHVLGATGSGKSTLLTNLILADVTAQRGAVVIDPKGDLVTDILDRLPATAAGRTVIVDPDDAAAPPSLNLLDGPDADLAVDNLVGIFRSIFERFWGPRTDDVLRAACLTLRHPTNRGLGATLADVPRLLSDAPFRARATAGITDPVGLGGFWAGYEAMGDAARAQVIGPVMNKLRAFLLRDFVRRTVGSATSSFAMADVLDGGLLLARVPKGVLGEETARLLGSFVVARVWQAATHRARTGQPARVDAALYVDECQNFLTLPRSFDEMLAEARGYHLSLVLAHQHLAQLSRELREAVSANARSKVFFAVSPEDARALERHVAPELSGHDLAHLGAYTAAARLVVAGEHTPAFTLATDPAPPPIAGRAAQVRAAARAHYGRTDAQRRADADRRRRGGDRRHLPAEPGPGSDTAAEPAGPSPGRSAGRSAGNRVGHPHRPTSPPANPPVTAPSTPDGATPDSMADKE